MLSKCSPSLENSPGSSVWVYMVPFGVGFRRHEFFLKEILSSKVGLSISLCSTFFGSGGGGGGGEIASLLFYLLSALIVLLSIQPFSFPKCIQTFPNKCWPPRYANLGAQLDRLGITPQPCKESQSFTNSLSLYNLL